MTGKLLPINFTLSEAAKAEIAHLRTLWPEATGDEPGIPVVTWGEYAMNDGREFGQVIVSFYSERDDAEMRHLAERVSGIDLVFFVTQKHWWRFSGKVLDHSAEKSFHLR